MSTTFSTDSTANATPLTLDSALSAQVQVLGDALREKVGLYQALSRVQAEESLLLLPVWLAVLIGLTNPG